MLASSCESATLATPDDFERVAEGPSGPAAPLRVLHVINGQAAEIVLVVRIVVAIKAAELTHGCEHFGFQFLRQRVNAGGEHDLAADETMTKIVVQFFDAMRR